jgi:peroxiredoxin
MRVLAAVLVISMFAWLAGCKIEESEHGLSGALHVSLSDSSGDPIDHASIWLDGNETSQHTPALLTNVSVGSHVISAVRPDVFEVFDTVEVTFGDTADVSLISSFRPVGPVQIVDAPDGTVLLLNTIPSGTTPPMTQYVGIGTHLASLYLPGYATDLPARWTLNVVQNDTARIVASFTQLEVGGDADYLAPTFALADDRDSSVYRLQDYRGQVLLLTFFYVDCAPCVAEMPAIQQVYADTSFAGRIQFFGIDPNDSYFQFSQFRTIYHPELGLTFVLLSDPGQVIRNAYGVSQFPTNVIVDQTGTIRYRFGGITLNVLRDAIQTLLAESP